MLKKLSVVVLAISMFAGLAHARIGRSNSLTFAHFPTCSEGMVKEICVCRAQDAPRRQQLCRSGRYCHTFNGVCRQ
jgi:hypothetical protein